MLIEMNGQLPVWPYYALAIPTGMIGAALLFFNLGTGVPAKEELQRLSGTVGKVTVIDDLSGQPASMNSPMNSIHFTLKEVEGEFRYPSRWPGYSDVYERLAFHVDVWVSRSDMGNDEPMVLYQLEQQTPKDWPTEPISVSYEQIIEAHSRSRRSYIGVGAILLATSAGLVVIALLVRAWNRRQRTG